MLPSCTMRFRRSAREPSALMAPPSVNASSRICGVLDSISGATAFSGMTCSSASKYAGMLMSQIILLDCIATDKGPVTSTAASAASRLKIR